MGHVVRSDIIYDAQGQSRGFGQVMMASEDNAQEAVKALNGLSVEGKIINVKIDTHLQSLNQELNFL